MPASEDLRNELAAVEPRRPCDRLAQLSAMFHAAGSLHLHGRGELSVHVDLASSAAARRAFSLLRSLGAQAEIRTYRRRAFERATRYQLHVAGRGRGLQVLEEAGVLGADLAPLPTPPRRVVARACCRRAYLRGALLAAGSLSGPRAPQLEARSAGIDAARFLAAVAEAQGLTVGVRERASHAAVYARGLPTVVGLLAAAGAGGAALALEEQAVMGETRARANRLANADHANLTRTSRAAATQVRAVRRLAASERLAKLPPALQELADLRLAHPSLSLRELGLKCRPPVAKAAAHRRLQALQRHAEH
ncbi:MAG: DNA-binding protein WhiA [Gaiellaceae bacterium]